MGMTLQRGIVDEDILDAYEDILAVLPDMSVKKSDIGGRGIFVDDNIAAETLLMEYTGNCIDEADSLRMHAALDALWQNPDVFL